MRRDPHRKLHPTLKQKNVTSRQVEGRSGSGRKPVWMGCLIVMMMLHFRSRVETFGGNSANIFVAVGNARIGVALRLPPTKWCLWGTIDPVLCGQKWKFRFMSGGVWSLSRQTPTLTHYTNTLLGSGESVFFNPCWFILTSVRCNKSPFSAVNPPLSKTQLLLLLYRGVSIFFNHGGLSGIVPYAELCPFNSTH